MAVRSDIEALAELLLEDEAISAYCTTKYNKLHTVAIGDNSQKAYGDDHTPLLLIFNFRVDDKARERYNTISVGVQVKSSVITTEGRKITNEGFLEAEEIRERIRHAVANSNLFLKTSFAANPIPNEVYPLWTCAIDITYLDIVNSYNRGGN